MTIGWDDDPNTWPELVPYRLLYLSDRDESYYCLIDKIDYEWANQYKWRLLQSNHPSRGPNGHKKMYVVRPTPRSITPSRRHIFLHKEIVFRAYGWPPNEKAIIGDHINGDSLDCRRSNLQWATPLENRLNRHGIAAFGRLV